jgi:hypothetical protein
MKHTLHPPSPSTITGTRLATSSQKIMGHDSSSFGDSNNIAIAEFG